MLHVHSVQWNAGVGNTDTLHPNSTFCSFSIPTSEIFENKIFVTTTTKPWRPGVGVGPQLLYGLLVHVVYKRMLQSVWTYSNLKRF